MTERARAWCAVVVWGAFIFGVSSFPRLHVAPAPWMKYQPDKIFHFLEYTIFGYFLTRAFWLTYNFRSTLALALATFAAGTLYSVSDEWHQKFIPGRHSDPMDVAADALGVAAGTYILLKKTKGSAPHA